MRATRYYQFSILLPLVVPAVVVGPLIVLEELTGLRLGRLLPGVDLAALILMGSVILAGLPYALFAIGALLLLRGRDAHAYRRFAVAAPVVFGVVFFLWNIVAAAVEGTPPPSESLPSLGGLALLVLPLGYLYVGLCFLGYRLLSRRGIIGEQRSDSAAV